ncbi:hypothetical protein DS031_19415 [Bacillus taeanensis]|uniref:Uncharacterized protein n=1 Tax=Bacillus taeanensis TaxID=273032 RepID=A0A366XS66_9BACI|nr:hypothetical protein DS031_19415 [Bacillus taeanensis]
MSEHEDNWIKILVDSRDFQETQFLVFVIKNPFIYIKFDFLHKKTGKNLFCQLFSDFLYF